MAGKRFPTSRRPSHSAPRSSVWRSCSASRTTKASWSIGSRRRAPRAPGVIINAGAYSHTSIALQDAFRALDKPVVEVHLSNPHQRERFRHHSYLSTVAKGVIMGFGSMGYVMAMDAMATLIGTGKATLQ